MKRCIRMLFVVLLAGMLLVGAVYGDLTPEQTKQAEELIKQFSSRKFSVRQKAVDELIKMGPDVLPLMKKTLARTKDGEGKLRCEMVIKGVSEKVLAEEKARLAARRLVEKPIKDLGMSSPPNCRRFVRSQDLTGFAYRMGRDHKGLVFHNGKKVGEQEQVSGLKLSPDGRRLTYSIMEAGKFLIVLDGKKSPYEHRGEVAFSQDSKRVAFGTKRGDKRFIVCDGKEGKGYDATGDWRFSHDSQHLAYTARRGDKEFIVIDGIEGLPHDKLFWTSGPEGLQTCKVVDDGQVSLIQVDYPAEGERKPTKLVERRIKFVGTLPPEDVVFWNTNADGDYLVAVVKRGEKKVVFFNGKELGTYDQVGTLSLSPDVKRLAYRGRRGQEWFAVCDGKESPSYEQVYFTLFSPDSRRWAYSAKSGGRMFVVCDGKRQSDYDRVFDLTFSPQSKRFAYKGELGNQSFIVCDGKKLKEYGGAVWMPVFSPDGKHLAYSVRGSGPNKFIVCDEREGPEQTLVSGPFFSPDSKHLGYVAKHGLKYSIICDGIKGSEHDRVLIFPQYHTLKLVNKRGLSYTVVDGGRERLVEVDWPKDRDWTNGLKTSGKEE